jgi:hypothetical protein
MSASKLSRSLESLKLYMGSLKDWPPRFVDLKKRPKEAV